MLVSGGKVIAIDSVKINKNDLKGDGVFEEIELSNARKEEINSIKNTANDAQSKVNSLTNRVNTIDNEVSTVKSDVETLKTNVNTVSAKTNANTDSINSIEADITNNIKPKVEQNTTNINTVSSDLSALSSKAVTNIYGNNLSAYVEVAADGTRKYRIDVAPQISDTIINGKNGISAKKEGTSTWNIGLSADYLSANALNNLSGNWQNTYSAVSSNSATWNKVTDKVDTTAFTPVKNDVETLKENSAHSTLSSKNDYIKVTKDGVNYGVEFISGDLATKTWVDRNYQEKGNYLSANALDNLSGKWQSTYNTVNTYSGDWQEVNKKLYTSAFEAISGDWAFSADVDKRLEDTSAWANATFQPIGDYLSADALDKIKETSAKWDSTYSSVYNNSAKWEEVSAKLDKKDFNDWSAVLDERINNIENDVDIIKSSSAEWNEVSAKLDISSFSSVSSDFALKTEVQKEFEQTSAWVKDNFLSANALEEIKSTSSNWNDTYSAVTANSSYWDSAYSAIKLSSENWNLTYDRVKTSAEIWNTVVDKLDKEDFTAWSAKTTDWDVSAYSGVSPISIEQHKVSIDLSEYYKKTETSGADELDTKFGEIENRIEPIEDDVATLKDFSAHNVVESSNQYIEVQSGTNKFTLTFTSGDLATKTWVGEQLADFGGFVVVTQLPASGDNKKIYLINDPSSPEPDQYKEYIYTENVWKCIGDTSVDLTQYYKKTETSSRQEISTEFTNTSAWANETFQPIGDYVTSGDYITSGTAWVLVNDNNNVQWSALDVSELGKKYIVKSTNGSVKVGSATVGNVVTYDLSADNMPTISSEYMLSNYNSATNKYELSGAKIVGENGVSAKYNPATNEWNVGLEEQTYCYAEAQSHNTTTTGLTEVLSNFENITCVGEDIEITSSTINMNKGLYHIDIQVNVTNTTTAPQYYDVSLTNSLNNGALTKVFDGSFTHTETLDLSFDVKLLNNSNSLTFTLTNMPIGSEYYVRNLQIHEIVTIDGLLDIAGGQYTGGTAIGISNENVINVKYDSMSGIGVTQNNELYVKLGKGLSFSNEGGVDGTLSLDEVTEGVVETVQSLQQELDNKLTTNMNISDAKDIGSMFKNNTVASLACSLFTVPLQHNLTTASEISFFTTQGMNQSQSFPIIIGLYEYNFDYFDPVTHQYRSQTTWLGDTGPIMNNTQDVKGHAIGGGPNKYTFKLKHLTPVVSEDIEYDGKTYHNEYGPVMRSDRAYYLGIFARHTDGLGYVLGDAGYNAVTNSDPYISWYADNMRYVYPDKTSVPMDDNWDGWNNDLCMSAIDYWNRGGEANAIVRPLVMIRNVSE